MSIEIKIPLAELQKQKIFLAVPMYGGNCAGMFNKSVADLSSLCTHYKIPLEMHYLFNESLITRARNYCCDAFMRSDATHLMFIDSDIGFNANDVVALLALSVSNSEYDVITGPYPKKTISWEKIRQAVNKGFAEKDPTNLERFVGDYVFNPKAGSTTIEINKPVEVMEAGTGFMMIKKETFKKYQEAFPEMWYRPDHVRTEHFDGSRKIMAYFDCIIDRGYTFGDVKKLLENLLKEGSDPEAIKAEAKRMMDAEEKSSLRYLSEDYMFCYNVQKMGGKVWLCPWIALQHVGSYTFGGSLADLAAIGASATADQVVIDKTQDRAAKRA